MKGSYEDFSKGYKLKPNYKNEEVRSRYENMRVILKERKRFMG